MVHVLFLTTSSFFFFLNILSVAKWYLTVWSTRSIVMDYTLEEYLDMVDCFVTANRHSREAALMYHARYPNRDRFPDWRVIEAAYDRQRNGNIMPRRGMNGGHPITKRTQGQERRVLNLFRRDPCTSSRVVARETNMSCRTVNRITRSITSIRCTSYTEEILSSAWISRSFSWQSFGEILVCFSV